MFRRLLNAAMTSSITALLTGCWPVPQASIQPKGEPRIIESGIMVTSERSRQIVQAVDGRAQLITVSGLDRRFPRTYRVAPDVSGLRQVEVGNRVRLRLAEELTVYVPSTAPAQQISGQGSRGEEDARVLSVDRSYRVLTLQYPNGRTEGLKVGQQVRLRDMEPGDSVVIQSIEVTSIRRQRP